MTAEEKPAFGRSYQTPFADRIRHEVAAPAGVAVIAVGAISSYDDVNSILYAGRADLCALGRPHLYNPQWTLQTAAEQDYVGPGRAMAAALRGGAAQAADVAQRQDPAAAGPAARAGHLGGARPVDAAPADGAGMTGAPWPARWAPVLSGGASSAP